MADAIKKTKNNYYNEEKVQALLKKFQASVVYEDPDAEKLVIKEKDVFVENEIAKEVLKIVNAIISVYRYYMFEEYDDLQQHASEACFKNYHKFSRAKGTSFSYFSIISKISLLNYTDRRKKHRNHADVEELHNLEKHINISYDLFIDELETILFEVVDENFVGGRRKRYSKIASVLIEYIKKNCKFTSKSDMLSFCRSFGIKNNEVREFIKSVQVYNSEIFDVLN